MKHAEIHPKKEKEMVFSSIFSQVFISSALRESEELEIISGKKLKSLENLNMKRVIGSFGGYNFLTFTLFSVLNLSTFYHWFAVTMEET